MSPNAGGKGVVAGSQPMNTAVVHRSPNKLWRSNPIFNLCTVNLCTAPTGQERRPFFELISMIFTFWPESRTGTYPDDALELFSLLAQQFRLAHSASVVSAPLHTKSPPEKKRFKNLFSTGVADPDLYVLGPLESGSVSQRYGSGSFCHQAKIVKPLFLLFCDNVFLSLKNDENVPSKNNKENKIIFCWLLEVHSRK
jgi:hypothetical protein